MIYSRQKFYEINILLIKCYYLFKILLKINIKCDLSYKNSQKR